MKVIPNKECVLIIHKFELNCIFRIKLHISYLANSAEDESDLIRNIQFNSNLCIINMHSLFGITIILYTNSRLSTLACSHLTRLFLASTKYHKLVISYRSKKT